MAGDTTVDADLDRLLLGEEVGEFLGQRAGAGDDPQIAVRVEPLDHGEVVVEGLVQEPHRDAGHLPDAVGAGEVGGEAAGDEQALGLDGGVLDRAGHRQVGRVWLHARSYRRTSPRL